MHRHRMNEVRRPLGKDGYTIAKTNGGHWRYDYPDMDGCVHGPKRPSDYRADKNLVAALKRKTKLTA